MSFASNVKFIMNGTYPATEEPLEALQALGIEPTCGAMVIWAMVSKAIGGDVAAAKLLKDSLGEETAMNQSKNDFKTMSDSDLQSFLDGLVEQLKPHGPVPEIKIKTAPKAKK